MRSSLSGSSPDSDVPSVVLANLDDIQDLQDPESFLRIMTDEVEARKPPGNYTRKNPDPTANPDFVGRTVAIR